MSIKCLICAPATNLTAGTVYEVAVWAHTSIGDSPTALSHHQTSGTQPERPVLKSKALNQTAVDCSWSIHGSPPQVQQLSMKRVIKQIQVKVQVNSFFTQCGFKIHKQR